MNSFKTYDYIIVGGGSAGCVLANRLSANSDVSVLLVEAGPKDTAIKVRMPGAVPYVMADASINWYYYTEPQQHLNGRRLQWPRARILGGCSSHNTMVFVRGHARDYDHWRQSGCEGWSYADVLPYFRRMETRSVGRDAYHGGDGPMQVKPASDPNILNQAFIDAGIQAGFAYSEDFNGHQQEGVGRYDVNIFRGNRWNSSRAYLWPAMSRSNLDVQTGALVTRVLLTGTRATGVEFLVDGQMHRADASQEVVISAGAINTPQLLLLSGIGDAAHLKRHDIPVTLDLPSVGRNLQDHLNISVQHDCLKPVSLAGQTRLDRRAKIAAEWLLLGKGIGASGHLEAGAFLRTTQAAASPDIQHHFIPLAIRDHGKSWPKEHSFQASMCQLRQVSLGYLALRSNDPSEHPIMQPNYLDAEEDRRCMREGIKLTREILAQAAFDEFRGAEIQPGPDCQTDEQIDAFVRDKAETCYHPCGTCKMGTGADAVVDPRLRVYGMEGLRVADASIMPSIVSGNLNAPTIMIGEKAADMILGREPLPREEVAVAEPIPRTSPAQAISGVGGSS